MGDRIKDIKKFIDAKHRSIPEFVRSIVREQGSYIEVIIISSEKQYDDGLMDRFIELEAEIMDAYPDLLFDFHHVPEVLEPECGFEKWSFVW